MGRPFQFTGSILSPMSPPKIGAVSYLNTKPLVYGLDSLASGYEIVYDLPSRLADRLDTGELDVALVPVIEAVCNPQYTVVSDAAIACRGPVRSVKIVSRVRPECIESLALDEGSRTSVALAKILLEERHGVTPRCEPLAIDMDWRQSTTDAVLVIGDRAMHHLTADPRNTNGFQFEWDLGDVWHQWTGLPFVFAVWAAHPRANYTELDSILGRSRDLGVSNAQQIVADQAPQHDLSVTDCQHYLSHHLHFFMGDQEKIGLEKYFTYARQMSLIPQDVTLQFHDCQSTG